ncbi:MAG: HEAT repeat domain-containing protein [Candidatus Margulisiibacteriota bacterium]
MKMRKVLARKTRGQTTEKDDHLFDNLSDVKFIELLINPNPQKRTSAAKLLGERRSLRAVFPLCRQLEKERALYISFYSKDTSSFPVLLETLRKYRSDNLIVWKIVRALQAFPSDESIEVLEDFLLNSKIPALRWEAARSLGQIGTDRCLEILKNSKNGQDALVEKMVRLSIKKIEKITS